MVFSALPSDMENNGDFSKFLGILRNMMGIPKNFLGVPSPERVNIFLQLFYVNIFD